MIGLALGALALLLTVIEPYRMARLTGFLNPGADADGRRLPGRAGEDRARLRRHLRRRHRQRGAEGLLPARGAYRHDLGGDRRGARSGRDRRRGRPLRDVRLRRPQTAQRAKDHYGKLLVAGLTSLILVQATINLFAVMGLAPLTGVPLPFVSYGNSSLLATPVRGRPDPQRRPRGGDRGSPTRAGKLRVVEGGRSPARKRSRSSGGRTRQSRGGRGGNRGSRRARHGGRRRASG